MELSNRFSSSKSVHVEEEEWGIAAQELAGGEYGQFSGVARARAEIFLRQANLSRELERFAIPTSLGWRPGIRVGCQLDTTVPSDVNDSVRIKVPSKSSALRHNVAVLDRSRIKSSRKPRLEKAVAAYEAAVDPVLKVAQREQVVDGVRHVRLASCPAAQPPRARTTVNSVPGNEVLGGDVMGAHLRKLDPVTTDTVALPAAGSAPPNREKHLLKLARALVAAGKLGVADWGIDVQNPLMLVPPPSTTSLASSGEATGIAVVADARSQPSTSKPGGLRYFGDDEQYAQVALRYRPGAAPDPAVHPSPSRHTVQRSSAATAASVVTALSGTDSDTAVEVSGDIQPHIQRSVSTTRHAQRPPLPPFRPPTPILTEGEVEAEADSLNVSTSEAASASTITSQHPIATEESRAPYEIKTVADESTGVTVIMFPTRRKGGSTAVPAAANARIFTLEDAYSQPQGASAAVLNAPCEDTTRQSVSPRSSLSAQSVSTNLDASLTLYPGHQRRSAQGLRMPRRGLPSGAQALEKPSVEPALSTGPPSQLPGPAIVPRRAIAVSSAHEQSVSDGELQRFNDVSDQLADEDDQLSDAWAAHSDNSWGVQDVDDVGYPMALRKARGGQIDTASAVVPPSSIDSWPARAPSYPRDVASMSSSTGSWAVQAGMGQSGLRQAAGQRGPTCAVRQGSWNLSPTSERSAGGPAAGSIPDVHFSPVPGWMTDAMPWHQGA